MTDNGSKRAHPPRRWLRFAARVGLFLLLLTAFSAFQARHMASGPAPALQGTAGTPPAPLPQGEPVLVHFWATWCPVCTAEQGSVDAIAEDHPVVTVALRSGTLQEVSEHLAKEGLAFAVVNDPDGAIAERWGVRGVPASFVLDAEGEIRFRTIGYTTGLGLRARLWLAQWL